MKTPQVKTIISLFFLTGALNLQAAVGNDTWVGNTSALFSTGGWTGANNPPASGDSLVFGAAGTAGATLTADQTAISYGGITFNSGASAFTIGGANGITLTGGITNNSASLETLNFPIAATAVRTVSGIGNITLGGVFSGTGGGITMSGTGTLTLGGANTYTGVTTLSAGTLQLQNASALQNSALAMASGTTLSLEANANTTFAPSSLNFSGSGSPTYTFYVNNAGSGTGNTLILANVGQFGYANTTPTFNLTGANGYTLQLGSGSAGTGALNIYNNTTINSSTAGVNLSIPGGITINYPAAYTLGFGGAGNFNLGALTPDGANNITVNKTGIGTLTLSGTANLVGGTLSVSGGTLALTGNANVSSTNSQFLIGTASGTPAAVYQSGTSTTTSKVGGGGWQLGDVAGASGYYNLSGGTINIQNTGELDPAGSGGGAGTFGQFDMSGGAVNVGASGTGPSYFLPCRGVSGESSVVNLSGGTLTILNGMADSQFCGYSANWGSTGSQTSVTTISGSALFQSLTASVKLNEPNNAGNVGILNLNGGTWQMLGLNNSYNASVIVNFNGGTLEAANSANTTFLGNSAAAYVYAGGAIINNNGQNITITQSLQAPAGNGVSTIPVASGGAGYIMPPQVVITGGGGSGAKAYAQISGGTVTGIVVTSPGINYSSVPTVTLVGGGYTSAATLGTVTTVANSSGGLTVQGAGTLTLSGINTYSGGTTISAGTLVGVVGGSAANSAVSVTPMTGNFANLGVSSAGSSSQWTCSSLTFNSGGNGASLEFAFSATPSTTIAPLNITGNLTFNVSPTVSINPAHIATGVYPLLVVGGTAPTTVPSLSLRGFSGSSLAWGGAGFSANTLVLTVTGSASTVTDPLTWAASGSGTWDINDSGNAVWKDSSVTPQAAFYTQFPATIGDSVWFGDKNITANTAVTLNSQVFPASLMVSNFVNNYTIAGSGGIAGTIGLNKYGTASLGLSTANTYTGGTVVNAGTINLDFTQSGAPTANIISSSSALTLAGGTLAINGTSSGTSSQTFASTTLNSGPSIVKAVNNGTAANLALSALTRNTGGSLAVNLPTAGNVTTTTGTAGNVITSTTVNDTGPYAFVTDSSGNLIDFAAVSGSTPFPIGAGASAASAQYVQSSGSGVYTVPSSTVICDVVGSGVTGISSAYSIGGVRYNAPPTTGPWTFNVSAAYVALGTLLVTKNVGANNITINNNGVSSGIDSGKNGTSDMIWAQDNILGEVLWQTASNFRNPNTGRFIKIGRGTVNCSNNGNGWTGSSDIDGGVYAVQNNGQIGDPGTAAALNLNGGTLLATATFTADNSGVNKRPVTLLGNGGGLAAASGTTLTIDGLVGSAAGAGPLVIGIPASSANGSTAALVPGTGTINSTVTPNAAIMATGTVLLNAGNTYYGGTVLASGTLNINGINALGGGDYGGVTFNGGTLQYASGFSGNGSGDLTSVGTGGVTVAAGGGTIDLKGNSVAYASSIGNSGTGALTVMDSAGGGSLNLTGGGTYTGTTTVGDGTHITGLAVSGPLASASVTVQNNATLSGSGTLAGNVTFANGSSAKLTPGSPMTVSGTLTLNGTGAGNTINVNATGLTSTGSPFTLLASSSITGNVNPVPGGVGVIASGYVGAISKYGNNIILTVTAVPTASWTDGDSTGNWSDALNWNATVGSAPPSGAQATAIFGTGPSPVNLDVAETVGTVSFTSSTIPYTISGGNTLTLDGSGSGAVISMSSGAAAATISTALSLADNTTATVNSGDTLIISGTVSTTGSKTLAINGGGTAIITQANTYGGSAGSVGTTLGGATVQVGNNTALGVGDVSITTSSTLQSGASGLSIANNISVGTLQTLTVDNNGNSSLTLGTGVISGNGSLTKINAGTTTLGGANTYTGGTTINAGVVSISADGASASTAGNLGNVPASATANNVILNGGDLSASAPLALQANRGIGIGATSGSAAATGLIDAAGGSTTLTVNGIIASAGTSGAANLTVNSVAGTPGTVVLGGANTFNGTTTIGAGTLKLGNSLALQNSTLAYNSGTLSFGTLTAATLGALTGSQNLSLVNGSSAAVALTLGNNNTTATYTGILSGNGSLNLAGTTAAAAQTIGSGSSGGANYTGATTVSYGSLTLGGIGNITGSTGTIDVNGGNGQPCNLTVTDSANISTSGGIYLADAGGNNYPGACTLTVNSSARVSAAFLSYGNVTRVPSSTVTVANGAALSVSGSINLDNNAGTTTQNNVLNLNGGTLAASSITQSATGTGHTATIHFNGGVLKANASDAGGPVYFLPAITGLTADVDSGGLQVNPNSFNITIAAPLVHGTGTPDGGLTLNGTGTLTLNSVGNSFTGKTTIEGGGTLNINSEYQLGGAVYGGLIFNNGTLQYASTLLNATTDISENSAATPVAQTVTFTGNATIDVNGHSVTLSKTIGNNGAGGLTVESTAANGVLTLSAANLYSGNTTVSSGTLAVNNTSGSGTGSGSVTVQNAATLTGTGTISGAATINSGGILAPGSGTSGTLTLGASPTLNGTLAFGINKSGSTAQSQLALGANSLTYSGALTVTLNSGTLAAGDSFPLITTSGSFNGWFAGIALPALASGLSWDTNDLATTGVLDVYSFTTTPLTVSTLTNSVATIPATKLANHAISSKGVYPTGWTAVVSNPSFGVVSFDDSGNLIYTAGGTAGTDNFTVTFYDGHGSQTMAVTVTVNGVNAGPALSVGSGFQNNGGYATFTASGIPGTDYVVQYSTDLVNWTDLSPAIQALPNGLISFTDTATITSYGNSVYYRLRQQ